jgi:hypothetical protein
MRTRIVPSNTKPPRLHQPVPGGRFGETLCRSGRNESIAHWFVRIRTDFRPDDRVWHRTSPAAASAPLRERVGDEKRICCQHFLCEENAMNIGPFFGWEAFGPDDIKAISIAFDEVCSKLGLTDDKKQEEREAREASWPLRATANAILRPSATASSESLP